MNKITRYIGKSILTAIGLVMILLIGLELVFSLVNELRHIGTGNYSALTAMSVIGLSLPSQIAALFPMAALVGTLLGLGVLASRSELIVMQSAGISKRNIASAVLKTSLILIVLAWILGEIVAPIADPLAHQQKAVALSAGQALRTQHGVWIRDGYHFVHIQSIDHLQNLQGITRYEFDSAQNLQKTSFAEQAHYENNHWVLQNVKETRFMHSGTMSTTWPQKIWQSSIEPKMMDIVGVKALDELSLAELWKTIRFREQNALETKSYQLAFWQKMLRPFATLVMMFLAIPFIFGPLRSATMGSRMTVGVLVGFAFHTLNQLFGPLTLVYPISPFWGASLPVLLFFLFGLMGYRVRK